jgi:hypothetical protein
MAARQIRVLWAGTTRPILNRRPNVGGLGRVEGASKGLGSVPRLPRTHPGPSHELAAH